jgi:antitoxin ParD1/3/4
MSPTNPVPVPLTPEQQRFIQQQVDSGRYRTPEDVLLEGLRHLEEMERFIEENREDIRRKIEEGAQEADRGEFVDGEEVFEEWRRRDAEERRKSQKKPA